MRILTYFFTIFLACSVALYLNACGYKSDPYWGHAEKKTYCCHKPR